jgi:hypothetical protein
MSSVLLSDAVNCFAAVLGDHDELSKSLQGAYGTMGRFVVNRRLENILRLYFRDLRVYCAESLESGIHDANGEFGVIMKDRVRTLGDIAKLLEKNAGKVSAAVASRIQPLNSLRDREHEITEERLENHIKAIFTSRKRIALLSRTGDSNCADEAAAESPQYEAHALANDGDAQATMESDDDDPESDESDTDNMDSLRPGLVTCIKQSLISTPAFQKLLNVAEFLTIPEKDPWREKASPKNLTK